MTATTEPVATHPKHSAAGDLKTERMPFGRWMRLVGWRHVVAVVMIVWALFPVLYMINLSLSGGNTLTYGIGAEWGMPRRASSSAACSTGAGSRAIENRRVSDRPLALLRSP